MPRVDAIPSIVQHLLYGCSPSRPTAVQRGLGYPSRPRSPSGTTGEGWPTNGNGMRAPCCVGDAVCRRCVIVSRSPQGLERMMATLVDVLGAFGLTVSEEKPETMSLSIPHAPAKPIAFTTMGQQYRQTTSFVYLRVAITESSRLSVEIDCWIRAGWMSFNRYWAELYDRPTASLDLKTRMVKSEVVEALQYGCAAWTPLKVDYQKLRTAHHLSLIHI